MQINKIIIRNFGKIQDCTLELSDGLNVLSGSNESGKTTFYHFLRGMLFGMTRKRGKAAGKDTYSSYEPWENPDTFGGTIWFSTDGKEYRLTRNFSRTHHRFELTELDTGRRHTQRELEILLGGVSEAVYDNTVAVGQLKSVTGPDLTRELTNYMASCQGAADSRIRPDKAEQLLKLYRKGFMDQKEKRSRQLEQEIDKLHAKEEIWEKELTSVQNKLVEMVPHRDSLGAIEANPKKTLEKEPRLLRLQKAQRIYLLLSILGGMGTVVFLTLLLLGIPAQGNRMIYGFLWAGLSLGGVWLLVRNIIMARKASERRIRLYRSLDQKEHERKRKNRLREKLDWSIAQLREQEKELLSSLENVRSEYQAQEDLLYERGTWDEEIEALNLALTRIREASDAIRGRIGEDLQTRTSQILAELTDGKYKQVSLDEQLHMTVMDRERSVDVEQLSRGTIEQIFFAFRMASAELLCEGKHFPIVLDDVFGMYDEERLTAALTWLSRQERQVILCTCSDREGRLLDEAGLEYHELKLS
ncbi:MAG: AAA family ATPase [Blautia sp.]|nr:AAA family ATPase [Blautia sp.]